MTEKVKILTDDIELIPTKDFIRLADTIVSFVKGSDPKFTVGIYGDWGTGKTTLMKLVEEKLNLKNDKKKGKILTIWFDAWRYEREEQMGTVALMKTIGYAMSEHDVYKSVSKAIWNGMKTVGKDWAKQLFTSFIASEQAWNNLKRDLPKKLELINEIEKETIYFDGLSKIESGMNDILEKDADSRVVVFIDDLDRCSPPKVLEVLESIKIFFDIKGFVFVVGLSDRTMMKIISKHYENSGVTGEDYIQKIIQLPIRIPPWNKSDIEKIIDDKVAPKLDKKYSDFVKSNRKIIAIAVQPNPRELKRLINNLIVALEVYSEQLENKEIKENELLILEALKWRWHDFYLNIISSVEARKEINELLKMSPRERTLALREVRTKKEEDLTYNEELMLNIDSDLWEFLIGSQVKDTFTGIKNWNMYRKVTETTRKTIERNNWQRQIIANQSLSKEGFFKALNRNIPFTIEGTQESGRIFDPFNRSRISDEHPAFRSVRKRPIKTENKDDDIV